MSVLHVHDLLMHEQILFVHQNHKDDISCHLGSCHVFPMSPSYKLHSVHYEHHNTVLPYFIWRRVGVKLYLINLHIFCAINLGIMYGRIYLRYSLLVLLFLSIFCFISNIKLEGRSRIATKIEDKFMIKMAKTQQPNQQVRQYALTKCPYMLCINTNTV